MIFELKCKIFFLDLFDNIFKNNSKQCGVCLTEFLKMVFYFLKKIENNFLKFITLFDYYSLFSIFINKVK